MVWPGCCTLFLALLQCYLCEQQPPVLCPCLPACLFLALPGCAITLPASGLVHRPYCPLQCPVTGEEMGLRGGVVVIPYRRNVSHFLCCCHSPVPGRFLWRSCRTCSIILQVHLLILQSVEKQSILVMGQKLASGNQI